MDSRYPCHWLTDRRWLRLSDGAFRAAVNATAFSVSNFTDGHIHHDDLQLIPSANEATAAELVDKSIWQTTDTGWYIVDFYAAQTSASHAEAALENRRANDRERQRQWYERQRKEREEQALRDAETSREANVSSNDEREPNVGNQSTSREPNVNLEGKVRQVQGKADSLEENQLISKGNSENQPPITADSIRKFEAWLAENPKIKTLDKFIEDRPTGMDAARCRQLWAAREQLQDVSSN